MLPAPLVVSVEPLISTPRLVVALVVPPVAMNAISPPAASKVDAVSKMPRGPLAPPPFGAPFKVILPPLLAILEVARVITPLPLACLPALKVTSSLPALAVIAVPALATMLLSAFSVSPTPALLPL